jgi:thiamine biosynthesis protein ThiI
MDKELIIVRYGEIGIKSRVVRSRFEKRLIQNIKTALDCKVEVDQGRVFVYTHDYLTADEILRKTFGVVSFSPAGRNH